MSAADRVHEVHGDGCRCWCGFNGGYGTLQPSASMLARAEIGDPCGSPPLGRSIRMGNRDYMDKFLDWLESTTPAQRLAAGRRKCPGDCGCRIGPDENGNYDADMRECGCDEGCCED